MKAIRLSFMQMLFFIKRDMMLFATCLAPLLAGIAFKFVIPIIEKMLTQGLEKHTVLSPYYGLFDLFYSMLAPTMFCFVAAMVILEEHDEHIELYLFVTRLGRMGYFISHICIPAAISFLVTLALLPIFNLTTLSVAEICFLSITGTLQGVIIALLIVTLSTNKLEGMAITKLSTLCILGALAPYFLPKQIQYVLYFLPSFWIGKAIYQQELIYMPHSILAAGIWIFFLLSKFRKKI